jgi:hypothetical protein
MQPSHFRLLLNERCSCGDLDIVSTEFGDASDCAILTQVEVVVLRISDGKDTGNDVNDGYALSAANQTL